MNHPKNSQKLWLQWTFNCALGELLGIGVAGAIAFTVNHLVGEPQNISQKLLILSCMMVAGLIEGSFLGFFQWKVLSKKFTLIPQKSWMLSTILIAVLGWFLGMLPSLFLIPTESVSSESSFNFESLWVIAFLSIGMGLVLGAIFGLFQWFVFRKYALRATQWIWANALGWAVGLSWIYVFASIPTEHSSIYFNVAMGVLGGLLGGLSVGAVTGIYFLKIKPKSEILVKQSI
ncbi:MAG: hypothetical protein MUC49_15360 [Raineya sp.]|jgi:hypothetical protein|nr:hypothetical protein [Raineya sp.]